MVSISLSHVCAALVLAAPALSWSPQMPSGRAASTQRATVETTAPLGFPSTSGASTRQHVSLRRGSPSATDAVNRMAFAKRKSSKRSLVETSVKVVTSIVNAPIALTMWAPRRMMRLLFGGDTKAAVVSRSTITSTRLQPPPVADYYSSPPEDKPKANKYADYHAVLEAQRAGDAVVQRMKDTVLTPAQRRVAERASTPPPIPTPRQPSTTSAEALVQQKTEAERAARAAAEAAREKAVRAAADAAAAVAAASEATASSDGRFAAWEALKRDEVAAASRSDTLAEVDKAAQVALEAAKVEARAEARAEMEAAVAAAKAAAAAAEAAARARAAQAQADTERALAVAVTAAKADKAAAVQASVAAAASATAAASTAEGLAAKIAAELEKAQAELRAAADRAVVRVEAPKAREESCVAAPKAREETRVAAPTVADSEVLPAGSEAPAASAQTKKKAPSFVAVEVVELPGAAKAKASPQAPPAGEVDVAAASGKAHEGPTQTYDASAESRGPSSSGHRRSDRSTSTSSTGSTRDGRSGFGSGEAASHAAEVAHAAAQVRASRQRQGRSGGRPVARQAYRAQRQQEAEDLQAYHEACNARLAAMLSGGPPPQPPRGQPPQGAPPQQQQQQQQTFDFRRQGGGDAYNRYGNPSEQQPQQPQWQPQQQWAGAQGSRPEQQWARQEPWRGAEPPWPPQAQSRHPRPAQQPPPPQQQVMVGVGPPAHQWRARAGRYTGPPPLLSPEARLAMEGFGPNGYLAPQHGYNPAAGGAAPWDPGSQLQAELDQVQTLSPLAFNIMHHYKGQPVA